MLKQLEGSQGVAQAVALCRPDTVLVHYRSLGSI